MSSLHDVIAEVPRETTKMVENAKNCLDLLRHEPADGSSVEFLDTALLKVSLTFFF